MKKIGLLLFLMCFVFSCTIKAKSKTVLSKSKKEELITELKTMLQSDQQNRSFLSVGSLNVKLIDSVNDLSTEDYVSFRQSHTSDLSRMQKDSLWDIQNNADLINTNRLYDIIQNYGWLKESQLDSTIDLMIFLFHTPKGTIDKMKILLLEEVHAKRMAPQKYAMYVDNMRKKAFGQHQLYGTGDEYDSETNTIVPPFIENIDLTNIERKKIGLEELKIGDYRNKN